MSIKFLIFNCRYCDIKCIKASSKSIDNCVTTWVLVKTENEWRPIDANFASRAQKGGEDMEWELIDHNGEVIYY